LRNPASRQEKAKPNGLADELVDIPCRRLRRNFYAAQSLNEVFEDGNQALERCLEFRARKTRIKRTYGEPGDIG
jgi:hypothetical protein